MQLPDNTNIKSKPPLYKELYIQVLLAMVLGILIGHFWPHIGASLKPLGDIFIKLIKMVVTPVIFLTLTVGIAKMADLRSVGKLAARALVYFLFFSTLALVLGLVTVNIFKPGAGLNIDPTTLDSASVASYIETAHERHIMDFIMSIFPTTLVSPFVTGNVLQLLVVALLFGIALSLSGEAGHRVVNLLQDLTKPVFKVVNIIMQFAPFGAFGAIAFTIGFYGLATLLNLLYLILLFYATGAFFVICILGVVCRRYGVSVFAVLRYIKEEIFIVLAATSSEAALPSLMQKLEKAGIKQSTVGLVIPLGYSFNLDGSNIYMTLCAIFLAQSMNIDLSIAEQLALLAIAFISSKGVAGVPGAGFITLAATLTIIPSVPVASIAILLGIDRFMDECRSLVNFIGNAIATIIIAHWEDSVDKQQLKATLDAA